MPGNAIQLSGKSVFLYWLPVISGYRVWHYPQAYIPCSRFETVAVLCFFSPTMSFSLRLSQSRVEYKTLATSWRFQQLSPVHVAMYPRFTPASTSDLSISDVGETSHHSHEWGCCTLFSPALGRWDFHPHRILSYQLVREALITRSHLSPYERRFKMNESHSRLGASNQQIELTFG